MERLTERNKSGCAMAACCGKACEYNYVCEVGGFGECKGMDDIIDRLAAIEDILGDDYDLDHLRELVEADRAGRCVVLPCNPGTRVWCIVEVIRYGYPDPQFEKQLFLRPFKVEWASSFGKTVFLTREAAEAALNEEKHPVNSWFMERFMKVN